MPDVIYGLLIELNLEKCIDSTLGSKLIAFSFKLAFGWAILTNPRHAEYYKVAQYFIFLKTKQIIFLSVDKWKQILFIPKTV